MYVDDITVSGEAANRHLLGNVREVVRAHGLKTKHTKSITYAANSPKLITGAIVAGTEVRLPNIRHKRIWQTRKELQLSGGEKRVKLQRVLRGRLQEAKQILG